MENCEETPGMSEQVDTEERREEVAVPAVYSDWLPAFLSKMPSTHKVITEFFFGPLRGVVFCLPDA